MNVTIPESAIPVTVKDLEDILQSVDYLVESYANGVDLIYRRHDTSRRVLAYRKGRRPEDTAFLSESFAREIRFSTPSSEALEKAVGIEAIGTISKPKP